MEIIETNPKQRPTLLTVLCILTFIGSGFSTLSNLMGMLLSPLKNFINPAIFENALDHVQDEFATKFIQMAIEIAQKAFEHVFEISLVKFLLYAASLTGAILMFRLKKAGFYLYTLAQILLIFVAPIFIGFNFITNIGILFASVFSLLFIALYAINLKHLN